MEHTDHPRIKICCIMTRDEAAMAVRAGADALGLVGAMPSGPGVITDDAIADIARSVPPPVATFLLTSEQSAAAIIAHHRRVHTSAIQIVDRQDPGTYAELRDHLPGIRLVQVVHVTGPQSAERAIALSGVVDALLLDTGRPDLAVKELGGTGRTHDWRISREIREHVQIPVFLAGGLNPGNLRRAIEEVGPFGIDVCSGVRSHGSLDRAKLTAFVAASGR